MRPLRNVRPFRPQWRRRKITISAAVVDTKKCRTSVESSGVSTTMGSNGNKQRPDFYVRRIQDIFSRSPCYIQKNILSDILMSRVSSLLCSRGQIRPFLHKIIFSPISQLHEVIHNITQNENQLLVLLYYYDYTNWNYCRHKLVAMVTFTLKISRWITCFLPNASLMNFGMKYDVNKWKTVFSHCAQWVPNGYVVEWKCLTLFQT